MPVSEVQDMAQAWGYEWAASPGVYVFTTNESVQYIGKAMAATGLAQRVNNNAGEGDDDWNSYLNGPSAQVLIFQVNDLDELWVLSLEYYLIVKMKPPFNKRRG